MALPDSATRAVFEQRIDAYMRRTGRLRATYLGATYTHPPSKSYWPTSGWSSVRARLRRAGLRARSLIDHPALRP